MIKLTLFNSPEENDSDVSISESLTQTSGHQSPQLPASTEDVTAKAGKSVTASTGDNSSQVWEKAR